MGLEGGGRNQERVGFKCKQELARAQDGDNVSITTENAEVKGKVVQTFGGGGGFTLELEHPSDLKGSHMEVRLGGAVTGGLKAPFDESFFYSVRTPDGRAQPETQSTRLKEVKIER